MIKVTIEGLEDLQRLWRIAPDTIAEELRRATLQSELLLVHEIVDRTPIGVSSAGGLRGGTKAHEPFRLADSIIGVVSNPVQYAVPVEIGSRPHFIGTKAIKSIEDWVRQKGIGEKNDAKSIAFAIARKISKQGTKGQFMFRDSFNAMKPAIQRMYRNAHINIVRRLAGKQ